MICGLNEHTWQGDLRRIRALTRKVALMLEEAVTATDLTGEMLA